METYIGTIKVKAQAMTRKEYCDYRQWELPLNENGEDPGYLVEYVDVYSHSAWLPEEVFNVTYKPTTELTFGHAIVFAEQGCKIARKEWEGTGMFVACMPELTLPSYNTQEPGPKVNDRTAKYIGKDTPLRSQPYFAMFTAKGTWQPGWVASQADMLAKDWCLVD